MVFDPKRQAAPANIEVNDLWTAMICYSGPFLKDMCLCLKQSERWTPSTTMLAKSLSAMLNVIKMTLERSSTHIDSM